MKTLKTEEVSANDYQTLEEGCANIEHVLIDVYYDVLDHLTQWSATGKQEQYAYDASGTRTLKRSTTGSTTTLTVYAFGLEEHVYTATGSNTGNTYYYSLGGRLLGSFNGSSTQFYLTDILGSVITSFSNTASSAAVLGNQVYGPYGNQRYAKGNVGTSKGFTGQHNDSLSGLDYYKARYYDPVVGLFVSADTKEGNGQGMNPYGYVKGNPETKNDPTGQRIDGVDGDGGGGGTTPPPTKKPTPPTTPSKPQPPVVCSDTCAQHSKGAILKDLSDQRSKVNALISFAAEVASGLTELITAVLDLLTQQWVRLGIDIAAVIAHFVAAGVDFMVATGQKIPSWLATVETIAHTVGQVADFVSEIADVISIVFPNGALGKLAEKFLERLEPVLMFRNPKTILQLVASAIDFGYDINEHNSEEAWNQEQQNIEDLSPQDAFNQCIATHSIAVCS